MPFHSTSWLSLLLSIIHGTDARNTSYFGRNECRAYILGLQSEPGWSKNTPVFFAATGNGLLTGAENMTVTLRGCQEFCGPRSFYWDAGPRITTWVIPILLLVSNIELSPIDKKRFMTIVHALGDPIDSFWSIIHKLYIWHRLYQIGLDYCPESLEDSQGRKMSLMSKLWFKRWRMKNALISASRAIRQRFKHRDYASLKASRDKDADLVGKDDRVRKAKEEKPMGHYRRAQIIATVLSGFEEISGSRIRNELHYHMIIRKLLGEKNHLDEKLFEEWRKCARILADARTNEFLRTCLAIVVYFLGLIAAFVPEVGGGNTTPPGGRIAAALYLSWLVPLSLFSNRVGAFTSRRACLHIMRGFIAATTKNDISRERSTSDISSISPTETGAPYMSGALTPSKPADDNSAGESSKAGVIITVNDGSELNDPPVTNDGAAQWAGETYSQINSATSQTSDLSQDEESDIGVSPPTRSKLPSLPGFRKVFINDDAMEMKNMKSKHTDGLLQINTKSQSSQHRMPRPRVGLIRAEDWDQYFSALQWLGAIYTYRPWKVQYKTVDRRTHAVRNNGIMALAGLFPVLVSAVGASLILWYAVPVGFSCRSVWAVVIFLLWIVSSLITTGVYVYSDRKEWLQEKEASKHGTDEWPLPPPPKPSNRNDGSWEDPGRILWRWILFKDAVIAAGCVTTIFLSTAGIFNSCYCWSVAMTRKEKAVVPLNTDQTYEDRAIDIYSGIVITCIGLQVIFFYAITDFWGGGLRVARWSEEEKRKEWEHESKEIVRWADQSHLLFWYYQDELDTQEEARKRRASVHQLTRQRTFSLVPRKSSEGTARQR
jgi:hypothetical protein